MCFEQFKINKKQLSLCPFIAHLYHRKIINISNIQEYIDLVFEEIQIDPEDDDNLYIKGEDNITDKSALILTNLLQNIFNIVIINKVERDTMMSPFSDLTDVLYNSKHLRQTSRSRCLISDLYDKYKKIIKT
jgi:hypothetical protein